MKTIAFVLSVVLAAQIGNASVVSTQLASTNVSSFTSNNLAFAGGFGATLPATVAIASTVTPGQPPVPGVGTSSSTMRAGDTYNGLDVNSFTWTVTTTGDNVDVVRFDLISIVPATTAFRFVQLPAVPPAGWTRLEASPTTMSFISTTGLKAPGVFVFSFLVDGRDALAPGDPGGPNTGSFTINMAASNPEPGSLALCGLASVIAGGFGWRRRRTESDEVTPTEL